MLFNLLSNNKDRSYIGIDYEFRNREIALMQINFESEETRYICIVNPGKFDELQMKYLIELMINMKIEKIFHGADSLDIPYTLHEMLKDDKIFLTPIITPLNEELYFIVLSKTV